MASPPKANSIKFVNKSDNRINKGRAGKQKFATNNLVKKNTKKIN